MATQREDLQPGTRLGPYEIVQVIGAGGMGKVYKAHDARLNRDVAIKTALEGFGERFQREARAVAALNHPHICTIYDVGEENGVAYIAMELLEGETLQQRIHGQPLPAAQVVEIARQVASGLEAAHSKGIIHRDIKPANVFITRDGQAKIMDFGLAKLSAASGRGDTQADTVSVLADSLTQAGTAVGTVAYMSPEQARGEPLDGRSDLFSFGAVLFEMTTGVAAFRGGTMAAIFDAVLHQKPPEVRTLSPGVPAELERVIAKALEKNREQRYQNAAELQAELLATGSPPAARQVRTTWAIAAAIVVVGLAIGAWYSGIFRGAGDSGIHSIAVLPLENLSAAAGEDYFTDGMTDELIAAMARIRGWRVISRTSVMQYKNARKALPVIAKELGVDAVIEGTVQKAENRVRINAKLVRANREEENLWAQSYDRDLRDVLDMQAEVARSIASQIKLTLTPQEQQQLTAHRPVDPEVFQLYLRGKSAVIPFTEEALVKGIGLFEEALKKDPSYAPAHAAMALAYTSLNPGYRAPKEVMPKAREHAVRAIELDDTLSEAHTALADVMLRYDWNWAGAEKEIKRAIELNPNSTDAHSLYGNYLTAIEDHGKAIAELTLAHELDPLSLVSYANLLYGLVVTRDYDRTIAECKRALQTYPDFSPAYGMMGMAYLLKGQLPEAIEATLHAQKLDPENITARHLLAMAYATAGNRAEAEKLVKALEESANKRYACAYEIASVHVRLGNKEKAAQWLQRGVEEQCDCMIWLKTEPWMDPLRLDARYDDLIKRVNFPVK